ncbi:MAG: YebG family protein [Aeromonadaceae bacterium]
MAVEIKYVVVRNGEEKMTFVSKKEADAYDKMLDLADELTQLLAGAPIALDETQQEALALFLAQQREQLTLILKGGKLAGENAATEGEESPKRRRSKQEADAQEESLA